MGEAALACPIRFNIFYPERLSKIPNGLNRPIESAAAPADVGTISSQCPVLI